MSNFRHLKGLVPAQQTSKTPKKGRRRRAVSPKALLTPKALRAAMGTANTLVQMHKSVHQVALIGAAYADMRRLSKIAARGGLTRELLAYADPDGSLAKVVRTLPALESLDTIPLSKNDPRTAMLLSGFKPALEEEVVVMQSWIEGTADSLATLLSNVATQVEEFTSAAGSLGETMEDGQATDEQLSTINVLAISADAAMTRLEACHRVLDAVAEPIFDANKAEDVEEARSILNQLVSDLAPFTGARYDGDDLSVTIDAESVAEEFRANEGTLLDKGYNPEKTRELLKQAAIVAGALKALVDRGPAMVERLKAICVAMSPALPEDDATGSGTDDTAGENGGEDTGEIETGGDNNDTGEDTGVDGEPAQEDDDAMVGTTATRSILSAWVSLLLLSVEAGLGAVSGMLEVAGEVSQVVTAGGTDTTTTDDTNPEDDTAGEDGGENGGEDGEGGEGEPVEDETA